MKITNCVYDLSEFDTIPSKGKEREKWINEFKKSYGCSMCGYNKCVTALHFHHTGIKNKNVSMLKQYPTWRVVKEICSCIILCANCHIELHEEMK